MIKSSIAIFVATTVSCLEVETEGILVGGWNVRFCDWKGGNESRECTPEEIEMMLLVRRQVQKMYGAQFSKYKTIAMAS